MKRPTIWKTMLKWWQTNIRLQRE